MISCPAAKGMAVSRFVPIATEHPSTTHRDIASVMSINFEVVTLSNPFQGHYKILTNKAKENKTYCKTIYSPQRRKGRKENIK
jgi:hypothetical protein